MDLDDFFENKHKRSGRSENRQYHDRHHDYKDFDAHHSREGLPDMKNLFLSKIWNNPANRKLVVIVGIVLIVFVILLIVLLLPVLLKLLQQVGDNGIKGVVDTLWNGSKE